jgi:hypothetical protein
MRRCQASRCRDSVQPKVPGQQPCGRCDYGPVSPVGAENLCHQVILVKHASGAVAPEDPEVIQVCDGIGQRSQRRGLGQGAVRPVRIVEVLVLAQHDHQMPLIQIKVRSRSSRRQLPIQRSMIEFIRGA